MRLFVVSVATLLCSFTAAAQASFPDGTLVFPRAGQHVHLHWVTPPAVSREAVLDLQWMSSSPHGPAEPAGAFSAQLWMPAMGHGSSPVTIQQASDAQGLPVPGAYRISKMYFIMEGAWEIRVSLTQADGTRETQTFTVELSSAAEGPAAIGGSR